MKATFRNVIIKEIVEDMISSGGLFLGEGKDVKFSRGEILGFGDMAHNLTVGDFVRFDKHKASRIIYCGDELLITDYENIVIVE